MPKYANLSVATRAANRFETERDELSKELEKCRAGNILYQEMERWRDSSGQFFAQLTDAEREIDRLQRMNSQLQEPVVSTDPQDWLAEFAPSMPADPADDPALERVRASSTRPTDPVERLGKAAKARYTRFRRSGWWPLAVAVAVFFGMWWVVRPVISALMPNDLVAIPMVEDSLANWRGVYDLVTWILWIVVALLFARAAYRNMKEKETPTT
jgi:hypothetical protein